MFVDSCHSRRLVTRIPYRTQSMGHDSASCRKTERGCLRQTRPSGAQIKIFGKIRCLSSINGLHFP